MRRRKVFLHEKGITYFDKKTEKIFFFIATIVMLIWGVFAKFGIY